ncbi:hypothetical protein DSM109990_02412 [Sulfitobacter dubius]|uniref:Uncharacterized protein n=1 Tax=Sulfitobacter dubius TaxID=218673 RepID=A0ABY3ZN82_9RHOB|nr:hypothetical protein DSM109990_02412 [Sulfitobacter dubius]
MKANKEKTLDCLARLEGQVRGIAKWLRPTAIAWTS